MRITFIAQDLFAQGAQAATAGMVRGFVDKGYDVDLIVSKVHDDIAKDQTKHAFPVPESTKWIHLLHRKARHNIVALRRYLKSTDSVAVVSMSGTYTKALAIAALGLKKRPRLYTVEHGVSFAFAKNGNPLPPQNFYSTSWWWNRFFVYMLDGFLAVSKGVALGLSRVCHIPASRVSVVYNPVLDELFTDKLMKPPSHPWLVDKKVRTFVAAGAYCDNKQHMLILKAIKEVVKKTPLRLIIFGRGPLESEYRFFIKENKLEHCISIAGYTDCLPAEIKAADGFICSSYVESFGIAIVEALACGVPVISTNAPCGPAEILQNGRFGELVPVGDVKAMAMAIKKIAMGFRSDVPTYAFSKYSIQNIVRLYEKALCVELIKSKVN